jgi:hypothetical protein
MKYLLKAKLKDSRKLELLEAVEKGTLGEGSVAFGEYVKNMNQARVLEDGTVCWIEICFCATPLNEEMPYWKEYFDHITVENAQDPLYCQDANGELKRACFDCSCTQDLEEKMLRISKPFIA